MRNEDNFRILRALKTLSLEQAEQRLEPNLFSRYLKIWTFSGPRLGGCAGSIQEALWKTERGRTTLENRRALISKLLEKPTPDRWEW